MHVSLTGLASLRVAVIHVTGKVTPVKVPTAPVVVSDDFVVTHDDEFKEIVWR